MFNKKACTECGESLGMALLNVGGRCDACHYKAAMQIADVEEAAEAKLQAEADVEAEAVAQAEQDAKIACDSVVVTTEEALPVIERLGIVGAEVVYGSGPMKDLKAGFTNMVGGRSTAVEKLIIDGRAEATGQLKARAHALGGTAVVAVRFAYDLTDSNGGRMVVVTATGTAVKA